MLSNWRVRPRSVRHRVITDVAELFWCMWHMACLRNTGLYGFALLQTLHRCVGFEE